MNGQALAQLDPMYRRQIRRARRVGLLLGMAISGGALGLAIAAATIVLALPLTQSPPRSAGQGGCQHAGMTGIRIAAPQPGEPGRFEHSCECDLPS